MKKFLSLILIIMASFLLVSCGTKTFDDIEYTSSEKTGEEMITLYNNARTNSLNFSNYQLSVTKSDSIETTHTTIKIGTYASFPIISISGKDSSTIYYKEKKMVDQGTPEALPVGQNMTTLVNTYKAELLYYLSATTEIDSVYEKSFDGVTYYKVILNTQYVNNYTPIKNECLTTAQQEANYPDYIYSYSFEFGIEKSSENLVMFRKSYVLQNHNRVNYYKNTKTVILQDNSANLTIISDPTILNPML